MTTTTTTSPLAPRGPRVAEYVASFANAPNNCVVVNGTPRLLAQALRVDAVQTLMHANETCERALADYDEDCESVQSSRSSREAMVVLLRATRCACDLVWFVARHEALTRDARERGCLKAMARTMVRVMCAIVDWDEDADDVKRQVLEAHLKAVSAKIEGDVVGDTYVVARELECEQYLVALAVNMQRALLNKQTKHRKGKDDAFAAVYTSLFDAVFFRNDRVNLQGDRVARAPATTAVLRAVVYACRFHSILALAVDMTKPWMFHHRFVRARALYRHIVLSDEVDRAFDAAEMGDGGVPVDEFAALAADVIDEYVEASLNDLDYCATGVMLLLLDITECLTADTNAYEKVGERLGPSLANVLRLPEEDFERLWASKELDLVKEAHLAEYKGQFVHGVDPSSVIVPSHALSLFRILGNLHDVDQSFSPVTRRFVVWLNEGFTKMDEYFTVRRNCKILKRKVLALRDEGMGESLTEEEIEAWDDFVDYFDEQFTLRHPGVDINAMCREFASP